MRRVGVIARAISVMAVTMANLQAAVPPSQPSQRESRSVAPQSQRLAAFITSPHSAVVALQGATVIDVTNGRLHPNQTVVVVGTRVRAVGPAGKVRLPRDARVVDARGKYLVPGLWDMHVHPACEAPNTYRMLVAAGVTGIRDPGTPMPLDTVLQWRREIARGERVGPRQVVAGPYLQGESTTLGSLCGGRPLAVVTTTAAEARRAVDSLKAAGADLIKSREYPDSIARVVYFAAAAEARRVGIPFGGHLPRPVTSVEASDSGAVLVDHSLPDCMFSDSMSLDRCRSVGATFRRNGTWLVTTFVAIPSSGSSSRLGWADRFWPDTMLRVMGREPAMPAGSTSTPPASAPQLAGVSLLRQAGVPIVTGSDATGLSPAFWAPGFTLHAELSYLVWGGYSPLEALQAATINAAKALGATDSLGTVAPGKLADLVLLDANPLADITNTTKIAAVMTNGRYFDRAALDRLLVEVAEALRGR